MTTQAVSTPTSAAADTSAIASVMHALVFHGADSKAWEEVPKPVLVDDTDAIVRVDATTICGSDLHILKGDVPAVTDGRILGHEAVGTVESVGDGVKNVKVGDRVLVSCITACGTCRFCREARYGQCVGGGGWILGHLIDGTQAEFVPRHRRATRCSPVRHPPFRDGRHARGLRHLCLRRRHRRLECRHHPRRNTGQEGSKP